MKGSRVVQHDSEAAAELNARLNAVQRERKAAYAHFQRLLAATLLIYVDEHDRTQTQKTRLSALR